MQAHGNAHHVHGQHVEHRAFNRHHSAIGYGAHEVGQAVDAWRIHAATNCDPVHDQRALVDATAHQALNRFKAVEVVALEGALDASCAQALDVFLGPAWLCRHGHFLVGIEHGRVSHRGACIVAGVELFEHVHLRGVDSHRHLVGLGVQLGQHVTGVVGQPLGGSTVCLGGKADGAAHLNNHLRHAGTHASDQLVELGQALAATAIEFTHMQVQHLGASVEAINGLLNLVFHGDGDFTGEVIRHPRRCVGSGRDDQGLLVFGTQVAVEKVHVKPLSSIVA